MNLSKVILIAVCVSAFFLSGCEGEAERKAKYLEKGKAYLEEENYEKAGIELKNALQIDPKYAEAYYLMGVMVEKSPMRTSTERNENLRKAFANYSKVIELDPGNIKAQEKLARFYLLMGQIENAENALEVIQTDNKYEIEAKLLKAAILNRKEDVEGAINEVISIIEIKPDLEEAVVLLSGLYSKMKATNKAISVLHEGLKNIEGSVKLRVLLANLYAASGKLEDAERLLGDVISIEPDELTHHINLAAFFSRQKKLSEAEDVLREAIKVDPEDVKRRLLLVEFFMAQENRDGAEKELLQSIEYLPEIFKLRFALAKLYSSVDLNKAKKIYDEIISLKGTEPDGLAARNELAIIAFSRGDLSTAEKFVDEILVENPRDESANLVKGKLALQKKDILTAINIFRSLLKDQPDSAEIAKLLSSAHTLNNEPEQARDVLNKLVELVPDNLEAKLNFARYLISVREFDRANSEIDKILAVKPSNINVLLLKVGLDAARQDARGVGDTLDLIKKTNPDNPVGYEKAGELFLAQKKYNDALEEFETALKKSDKLLPSLARIVKIYLIQKKPEQALARVTKEVDKDPNSAVAHELLGEIYLEKKDIESAKREIGKAIELKPEWEYPYDSLAKVYMAKGDLDGAIHVYREALNKVKNTERTRTQIASLYEKNNKYEEAIKEYEYVLKNHPENELAVNNLASLLIDTRGDMESLKRARDLSMRFAESNHPALRDTLAWAYVKLGETDKAIVMLEKIVEAAPKVPHFQYHLGMAYVAKGDKAMARGHLVKALESELNFPGRKDAEKAMKQL